MPRRLVLAGITLMVAVAFLLHAQSRSSSPPPVGDVPGPEECTIAPRSVESVVGIYRTAVAEVAPPGVPSIASAASAGAAGAAGSGTPVDAVTIGQIRATLREFTACYNARDTLRYLALFTDEALVRTIGDPETGELPTEQQLVGELTTPMPTPTERYRIPVPQIQDPVLLADGRVSTIVEFTNPQPLAGSSLITRQRFVFARVGDRWLIDDIESLGPPVVGEGTPPSG